MFSQRRPRREILQRMAVGVSVMVLLVAGVIWFSPAYLIAQQQHHPFGLVLGTPEPGSARDGTSWQAVTDNDASTFVLIGGSRIQATFAVSGGPKVITALQLRICPLGFKGHIGEPTRFQLWVSTPQKPDSFFLVTWDSVRNSAEAGGLGGQDWWQTFWVTPVEAESLRLVLASPPPGGYVSRYFLNDVRVLAAESPYVFRRSLSWGIRGIPYSDTITVVGATADQMRDCFVDGLPNGLRVGNPIRIGSTAVFRLPIEGIPTEVGEFRPVVRLPGLGGRDLQTHLSVAENPRLVLVADDHQLLVLNRTTGQNFSISLGPGVSTGLETLEDEGIAIIERPQRLQVIDVGKGRLLQTIDISSAGAVLLKGGRILISAARDTNLVEVFARTDNGFVRKSEISIAVGEGSKRVLRKKIVSLSKAPDGASLYALMDVTVSEAGHLTPYTYIYRLSIQNSSLTYTFVRQVYPAVNVFVASGDTLLYSRGIDTLAAWTSPRGSLFSLGLPDDLIFSRKAAISGSGEFVAFKLEYWSDGYYPSSRVALVDLASPDSFHFVETGSAVSDLGFLPASDTLVVLDAAGVLLVDCRTGSRRRLASASGKFVAAISLPPKMVNVTVASPGASPRIGHTNILVSVQNADTLSGTRFDLKTLPTCFDFSCGSLDLAEQRFADDVTVSYGGSSGNYRFLATPGSCGGPVVLPSTLTENATLVAFQFPASSSLAYDGKALVGIDNVEILGLGGDCWGTSVRVPYTISDAWLPFGRLPAGDTDGNGEIDLVDLTRVCETALQVLGGQDVPLDRVHLCDVNFDMIVDEQDLRFLRSWIFHKPELLPYPAPKRTPVAGRTKTLTLTLDASDAIDIALVVLHFDESKVKFQSLGGMDVEEQYLYKVFDLGQGTIGLALIRLPNRENDLRASDAMSFRLRVLSPLWSREAAASIRVDHITGLRPDGSPLVIRADVTGEQLYETEDANKNDVPRSLDVSVSPNPFNSILTLKVENPKNQHVDLTIFDILGRKVADLYHGKLRAGVHFFRWEGISQDGRSIPSGVYICRLVSANRLIVRKVLLVR